MRKVCALHSVFSSFWIFGVMGFMTTKLVFTSFGLCLLQHKGSRLLLLLYFARVRIVHFHIACPACTDISHVRLFPACRTSHWFLSIRSLLPSPWLLPAKRPAMGPETAAPPHPPGYSGKSVRGPPTNRAKLNLSHQNKTEKLNLSKRFLIFAPL